MAGDSTLCVSLRIGSSTWTTCHNYPDKAPILALYGESGSLTLYASGTGRRPSEVDTKFAEELVRAVGQYAAEIARLRTEDEPAAVD